MSAIDPKAEARLFSEALFASQPPGTLLAVSIAPNWNRPLCVTDPGEIADYAVGTIDAYARLTPITRRPPRGGRGDAKLSAALLGVTADLDVNGSPDGKGGFVVKAFANLEAAEEIAHALLEPTLTVASGYGLQPHWLLEEPLLITGEDDLLAANEFADGWRQALEAIAKAAGVTKFDAVYDLARVMRVPGSLNGKGEEPVPVRLLDDGGPRYEVAQLRALHSPNGGRRRTPAPKAASDDRVASLLDQFDTLAKIVRHRGSRPKDASPSGWDHMLACRALELGVETDADLAALLRHHRSRLKDAAERAKGDRADYIERTIAKARETVGPPVTSPVEILARLTRDLRLASRRLALTDVQVSGDEGLTKFIAHDGRLMVFDRLGDVAKPDRLADALAASFGVTTEFGKIQARRIAALVREYVGPATELKAEVMLAGWVLDLLIEARTEGFPDSDPARKHAVWQAMHDTMPSMSGAQAFASSVVVAVEQATGDHYIRSGWLQDYIGLCGSKDSPAQVRDRLLAIGLQQRGADGQIKATDPLHGKPLKLRFYIAPKDWIARWEARS
jgi:hypothetical protein